MDPTTLPHVHNARDLADDALAAKLRDGDTRRFAPAGERGRDGAPVLFLLACIVASAMLAGIPVGYILAVWMGAL